MRPVFQTRMGTDQTSPREEWGDCWEASIASVLELPLEDVPVIVANPDPESNWWVLTELFLSQFGLGIVTVSPFEGWFPCGVHLITGPSPRGNWLHTVVGRDGEIVHDPHPSGDGVLSVKSYEVFHLLDPAKAVSERGDTA